MRIAASSLALSLVLFAGPALAQTAVSPTSSGMQQNNQGTDADRYELTGPPPGQMRTEPMQQMMRHHQGMMRQGQMQPDQTQPGQTQPGQMMQHNTQSGVAQRQPGHMSHSNPNAVSFATQGQIKHSLETSGFKNVAVLPQSYLIRATAPDGSRIVMQVSPEGLYGVVVDPSNQEGNATTSGGTSSGTGIGTSGDRVTSGSSGADAGTGMHQSGNQ